MLFKPAFCRISLINEAVVVFPLVPVTMIVPRLNRPASRKLRSGATDRATRPGRVVPPRPSTLVRAIKALPIQMAPSSLSPYGLPPVSSM